jgi:NADPH2:quinone reductase
MAAVGALAGDPSADFAIGISTAFQKSMWFANFSANTVPAFDRREVAAELLAAASRGEVESVVHEVLPLEQAVVAYQKNGSRRSVRQKRSSPRRSGSCP